MAANASFIKDKNMLSLSASLFLCSSSILILPSSKSMNSFLVSSWLIRNMLNMAWLDFSTLSAFVNLFFFRRGSDVSPDGPGLNDGGAVVLVVDVDCGVDIETDDGVDVGKGEGMDTCSDGEIAGDDGVVDACNVVLDCELTGDGGAVEGGEIAGDDGVVDVCSVVVDGDDCVVERGPETAVDDGEDCLSPLPVTRLEESKRRGGLITALLPRTLWISANHLNRTKISLSSASSSESTPTPLAHSRSTDSLYFFFSALIFSLHCWKVRLYPFASRADAIFLKTTTFRTASFNCFWIVSSPQISNKAFISSSVHVLPRSAIFDPLLTRLHVGSNPTAYVGSTHKINPGSTQGSDVMRTRDLGFNPGSTCIFRRM